jgi:broad specificity phosphatase PhoE
MPTWWLIRHGETDWNLNGRFQGSSNEALNTAGQAQATSLASRLITMNFDVIYASNLQRVQQTAHFALNGRTDSIIYDTRLQEIDFGKWEGLKWDEIREQYPQEFAIWSQDS